MMSFESAGLPHVPIAHAATPRRTTPCGHVDGCLPWPPGVPATVAQGRRSATFRKGFMFRTATSMYQVTFSRTSQVMDRLLLASLVVPMCSARLLRLAGSGE
jgi:hypothetical protein